MIANYILMSYYTVVTGWLLYYFVSSIAGNLQGMTAETSPVFFAELRSSGLTQFIWTTVAIAIGFLICSGGLRGSVEKASKFMMGALIILIIILAANSLMIPGSSEGLAFYLVPDIERLKAKTEGSRRMGSHIRSDEPGILHTRPRHRIDGDIRLIYRKGAIPYR